MKKIVTNIALFAIMAGLLSACSKKDTAAGQQEDVIEVTFEEADPEFKLTDAFSDIKFVQLEMTDDCVIGTIRKVEDADGTLVVFTKEQEIFAFDKENGKFICKVGSIGESPDEYIEATDIYYDRKNNTVNVFDRMKRSIISYSPKGEYLKRRTIEAPIGWAKRAIGTTDGYLMISNNLSPEDHASDYAYTIIDPGNKFTCIDPFAPVYVKGYETNFATRPMTSIGKRISFLKFINDTIFTMEKGEITPAYKLSIKKRTPLKDVIAQMGSFAVDQLLKMSYSGDYFSGFGDIFETDRFLALVPTFDWVEGFFWIDKETNSGFRIPSSEVLNLDIDMVIQGRNIIHLVGSNEKELISTFSATSRNTTFLKEMTEHPELKPFSPNLKPFWESVDPNGNPCLIIYEH